MPPPQAVDAATASATKAIERYVHALVNDSNIVQGAAILPLAPVETTPTKKSIVLVQKGVALRAHEASAILERMLAGTLHRDYVYASGSQYMVTSVQPHSVYGRLTSMQTDGGIIVVKTNRLLVVATYVEPALPAEAIPQVERFAEQLVSIDF
mmetsp:Transcript_17358/g.44894  ORF Transcript_17358/g.44894 Transcript_17358/m.44894 type:complete len:153 (+) Transcript_17358:143-601(+)